MFRQFDAKKKVNQKLICPLDDRLSCKISLSHFGGLMPMLLTQKGNSLIVIEQPSQMILESKLRG